MSKLVRFPFAKTSHELVVKLVTAGYLLPDLIQDADAITASIVRLKEDLRRCGDDHPRSCRSHGNQA
jgi:hypothetical protein